MLVCWEKVIFYTGPSFHCNISIYFSICHRVHNITRCTRPEFRPICMFNYDACIHIYSTMRWSVNYVPYIEFASFKCSCKYNNNAFGKLNKNIVHH